MQNTIGLIFMKMQTFLSFLSDCWVNLKAKQSPDKKNTKMKKRRSLLSKKDGTISFIQQQFCLSLSLKVLILKIYIPKSTCFSSYLHNGIKILLTKHSIMKLMGVDFFILFFGFFSVCSSLLLSTPCFFRASLGFILLVSMVSESLSLILFLSSRYGNLHEKEDMQKLV